MRNLILLAFCLLCVSALLLLPFGCSPAPDFWKEAGKDRKKILVSFPPLYCITHAVAGEDAYVLCLLTTHGPHDFEPPATDQPKVRRADLVIYNGLNLGDEVFMPRLMDKKQQSLNIGAVLVEHHSELLLDGEEHVDAHGNKHKHGDHDPHVWLGPEQAMVMTRIIADKLGEIDPPHKKGYTERADRFIEKLKELQTYGQKAIANKQNKNLVTQHESLGYFAKAFGLNIVDSIQVKPGADPDAAGVARLIKVCKEKNVKVIAVEPQYSTKEAQVLLESLKKSGGADVKLVEIDPLETAPEVNGFNPDPNYYLVKMRANIDALAGALP
jgi:zinc transport system substrate-binding protein